MMKKPTVVDLFAGCGGLSRGFQEAGFEVLAANEIWEPAIETYIRNHPKVKMIPGDIRDAKVQEELVNTVDQKVDVIVGGPPCQAYSMAGKRDPSDPRGKLFEEYVNVVEKIQPPLFVMENVKGILSIKHPKDNLTEKENEKLLILQKLEQEKLSLLKSRKQHKNNPKKFKFTDENAKRLKEVKEELKELKAKTGYLFEPVTEKIKRRFKKMGYTVDFKLLNAANFGVPQTRERVIFIGRNGNGSIKFPTPTHSEKPREDLSKFTNGQKAPWITVEEAIGDLEKKEEGELINHTFTSHSEKFKKKIKNVKLGESVFGNYSSSFFRTPPNEPSRTVKENHGGVFVHYSKNRVMTPRELARLQTFPDDFIFEGSKSAVLKQIGNAVPVKLAEAIARNIKNMIIEKKTESEN